MRSGGPGYNENSRCGIIRTMPMVEFIKPRIDLSMLFSVVTADIAQAHVEDATYGVERPESPNMSDDEYAFLVRMVEGLSHPRR